ncbi:ribosomal protein L7/L12 [Longispora sp. NPDC051575]|uniref:ribosomal protein L7/L12 n=1 Tax=Longispora sp. NPDC051575 TaxID=3154943 RepID=UPI003430A8FD
MSVRSPGDGARAAAVVRAELFDVVLAEVGSRKIQVIKVVREITGLDLAAAKKLVERAPTPLLHRADRGTAERVRVALGQAGARVGITPLG